MGSHVESDRLGVGVGAGEGWEEGRGEEGGTGVEEGGRGVDRGDAEPFDTIANYLGSDCDTCHQLLAYETRADFNGYGSDATTSGGNGYRHHFWGILRLADN